MPKSRHTEAQMVAALQQWDASGDERGHYLRVEGKNMAASRLSNTWQLCTTAPVRTIHNLEQSRF
jgi:hypothetical protein